MTDSTGAERDAGAMAQSWEELTRDLDPPARGRAFEVLLADLLRSEGFDVIQNPGAARPRQTDLLATDRQSRFLIEAKWLNRPAGVDAVAGLRDRLGRVDRATIGVLVSRSGFTRSVEEEVLRDRQHMILLVDETDLDRLMRHGTSFRGLVLDKLDSLATHGKVLVGAATSPSHEARRSAGREHLAEAESMLVDLDGAPIPWVTGKGDYDPYSFVASLPDVDWVPVGGLGATTEMATRVENSAGLVELIEHLAGAGWISNAGWWTARQSGVTWHGVGAGTLITALERWELRYQALETIHHTEEVVYAGPCDGGLLCLTADVSARDDRRVWHTTVGLQLEGIPVNPHLIEKLCRLLDVDRDPYLRPLAAPALEISWPPRAAQRIELQPCAYVVEPDDHDSTIWVTGIVAHTHTTLDRGERPRSQAPDWWPEAMRQADLLMCDLRSHHPIGDPAFGYELWRIESTWLGSNMVTRVMADYIDDPAAPRVVIPTPFLKSAETVDPG